MNTDSRIVVEVKVMLPRELVDRIDDIADHQEKSREDLLRDELEKAYPPNGPIPDEDLEQ